MPDMLSALVAVHDENLPDWMRADAAEECGDWALAAWLRLLIGEDECLTIRDVRVGPRLYVTANRVHGTLTVSMSGGKLESAWECRRGYWLTYADRTGPVPTPIGRIRRAVERAAKRSLNA